MKTTTENESTATTSGGLGAEESYSTGYSNDGLREPTTLLGQMFKKYPEWTTEGFIAMGNLWQDYEQATVHAAYREAHGNYWSPWVDYPINPAGDSIRIRYQNVGGAADE